MQIIETNDLSKSYDGKKYALTDFNFSLEQGQICAIVGESGSGKTTLLRLIAGLERPSAGSIKIKGEEVSTDSFIKAPQDRKLGMVFQDFALFPHLTVEQNIAFGLQENKGETIEKMLTLVKLQGYNKRYPHELSGGQQQRIALVRTLAREPDLLLLDEPFSSLDASLRSKLRREIRNIVKQLSISMIFITHDIYDAIDIADEVIFLEKGRIIEQSPISSLFEKVENQTVRLAFSELEWSSRKVLEMMKR